MSMSWLYKDGRLKTSIDMGGKATEYGYDAAGRLLWQTSDYGQNLRYTYSGTNLVRIDDVGTSLSTVYAYDSAGNRVRERQVFLGQQADAAERLQNNTITFDNLNRVTQVRDDQMQLDYEYDANGNRVKIVSRYGSTAPITRFNAFDAMNRQTIVNGDWQVDAQGIGRAVRGSGHAITYDRSGNRLSDTYSGTRVVFNGFSYGIQKNAETTETYHYDLAGRLLSIERDGLLIDERHYDEGGRVSQSGLADKGARGVADVLKELGIEVARRVYTYNVFGHMTRQKDSNASLDGMQDTWFNGYDAMGNLTGYDVVSAADGKNKGIYRIDYAYRDSYKELKTTLAKDGSVVESSYDVNGNRISIVETKPAKTTTRNRLWYDADGHVQSYKKDGKDAGFNLIVNGNVLGEESASPDNLLGSNYMPVTNPSMVAAPSSYSVQSANETLQSIAQGLWGDGNLWYLIADANALTADSKLTVGDILRIPARVNTVHGDYDTYKPYDPSEQIGSTAPTMPPPKAKGCGVVGQIVMVVVAVAVTYITGGAASAAIGSFLAGGGVAAAGTAAAMIGNIAGAAVGAAVGSIASQTVGIAIGAQDGFSWKAVAHSALSNAITAGVTNFSGSEGPLSAIGGKDIPAAMARAAVSNAVSQVVSVATGLQDGFKWRNVAASAIGAGVGAKTTQYLGGNNPVASLFGDSKLMKATASLFTSGMATAVARGGKIEVAQIAADAFGNALGSAIGERFGGGNEPEDGNQPSSSPQPNSNVVPFSDAVAARQANPFGAPGSFSGRGIAPDSLEPLSMLRQPDFGAPYDNEVLLARLMPTQVISERKWTLDQQIAYDVTQQMAYAAGAEVQPSLWRAGVNGLASSIATMVFGGEGPTKVRPAEQLAWKAANPNRSMFDGRPTVQYSVDVFNMTAKRFVVTGDSFGESMKNILSLGLRPLGQGLGNFAGAIQTANDESLAWSVRHQGAYDAGANFPATASALFMSGSPLIKFNYGPNSTVRGIPINGATRNVPLGFESESQFLMASQELHEVMSAHGINDATIGVRGSSVTGFGGNPRSPTFGRAFGPTSDIDLFVESSGAVNSFKKQPSFVHPDKMIDAFPGLEAWSQRWSEILGRPVSPAAWKPGALPPTPAILVK